jgi:hypothetical protein
MKRFDVLVVEKICLKLWTKRACAPEGNPAYGPIIEY